jgi:DNA-binding IscR family transcriptional regulator
MGSEWDTIIAKLTPAQRSVVAAMCHLEDENDGWAVPIRLIANRLRLSISTVARHLENLRVAGAVQQSPFPGGGYRTSRHYTGGGVVT